MPVPAFLGTEVQEEPDESLVDYVTPVAVKDAPVRRILCPNSPGDGSTRRQLLEVAARFIPMVKPGIDFVVLPANVPELRYITFFYVLFRSCLQFMSTFDLHYMILRHENFMTFVRNCTRILQKPIFAASDIER